MKTAKDYLQEANEVVKKIDVNDAIEKHKSKSAIFIDVRDSSDIKKTGTILDGLEIPRGLIEFVADEATPLYNKNLKKDSEIIFNVASGVGTSIKNVFGLITNEIEKITGFNIEIENVSWPAGISEIEKRNFIGSAERLKSHASWNAKTSIEDGICMLVNHLSKDYL